MKKFIAAAAQMNTGADRAANIEKMLKMCGEAAAAGAELLVFPETSDYIGPHIKERGVDVPGEETRLFSEAAGKHGLYIDIGSFTENIPGNTKAGNLSLLFSPEGEIAARYRKVHMFDVNIPGQVTHRESAHIEAGDAISVARTGLGNIGMATCYDLRFPELFRAMALSGAEVFAVGANFSAATGSISWETMVRARAMENTCWMIAADQCGKNAAFIAHGHSMIVDPRGRILSEAGEEEEIIYAELDPEALIEARKALPLLKSLRRDVYNGANDDIM